MTSSHLFQEYLCNRRALGSSRGPLFLSTSNRNCGRPLSFWSWSKEICALADESNVNDLSTYTFRHLRLTDLARSGWDVHETAKFAGHRSIQTTLLYIDLSGVELPAKVADAVHGERELTDTAVRAILRETLERRRTVWSWVIGIGSIFWASRRVNSEKPKAGGLNGAPDCVRLGIFCNALAKFATMGLFGSLTWRATSSDHQLFRRLRQQF
jgi:hypothetical protein